MSEYSLGVDVTIRPPEPGPIVIVDGEQQPILTVHPDGRVTLDQPDKADEAAHTFVDSVAGLLAGRVTVYGPLRLTATGPGSRPEIVDYVRTVIEQRTTPNDDTTAERLARAITTSVLSRLGAGYSEAAGRG